MSGTSFRYDFEESPAYVNILELAKKYLEPGVVADLGAGAGAVGVGFQQLGFHYLGFEQDPAGLTAIEQKGLTAYPLDLRETDQIETALSQVPQVDAFCLIDVIEHLVEPQNLLRRLSAYAQEHRSSLLVSVPNVSHHDIATKLLSGRWDVTPTGLLDSTHLRYLTEDSLLHLFQNTGWQRAAQLNVLHRQSEHYEPHRLSGGNTPVGRLLEQVAQTLNPQAYTYQFIWLMRPIYDLRFTIYDYKADYFESVGVTQAKEEKPETNPALQVLVAVPDGSEVELVGPFLEGLAEQTSSDFSLIIGGQNLNLPEALQSRAQVVPAAGNRAAIFNVLLDISTHADAPADFYLLLLPQTDLAPDFIERVAGQLGTTAPEDRYKIRTNWGWAELVGSRKVSRTFAPFVLPHALLSQAQLWLRPDFAPAEDYDFFLRATLLADTLRLEDMTEWDDTSDDESRQQAFAKAIASRIETANFAGGLAAAPYPAALELAELKPAHQQLEQAYHGLEEEHAKLTQAYQELEKWAQSLNQELAQIKREPAYQASAKIKGLLKRK